MPQMADITITAFDDSSNIIYTGLLPAAGERSSAVWQAQTRGPNPALQPTLAVSSRSNGAQTARRVDFAYIYPVWVTDTNLNRPVLTDKVVFTGSVLVPQSLVAEDRNQAINDATKLLVSDLIRSIFRTGYSAT